MTLPMVCTSVHDHKPATRRKSNLTDARQASQAQSRRRAWLVALAMPPTLGLGWAIGADQWFPSHILGTLTGFVLLVLLGVCTYKDLTQAKIPNWATYPAFLWALAINVAASLWEPFEQTAGEGAGPTKTWVRLLGAVGLDQCLLGAVVCFGIMLFVYRLAGGGAGDVKLAAAIGALLGVERGLNVLIVSYIVAAVAIMSWVIWTNGPVPLLKAVGRLVGSFFLPLWIARPNPEDQKLLQSPVPLAVFFAVGTLAVVGGVTIEW